MGDLYTKPMAKSASLRRGLSPTIWSQVPLTEINNGGLTEGFGFVDDFLYHVEQGQWDSTAASTGTVTMDSVKGGVLLIDSAAGGDNQGIQIQYGGTAGAGSFQASATSKIYLEARYKIVDCGGTTPDDINIAVGLATVDTTILASGAHNVADAVLIQHIDDSTNYQLAGVAGSATAVLSGTIGSIVDGTYIKVGFFIDGVSSVTPYINGVAKTAITSGIPTGVMAPAVVAHGTSAVDPIVHLDWLACYQVEQIAN